MARAGRMAGSPWHIEVLRSDTPKRRSKPDSSCIYNRREDNYCRQFAMQCQGADECRAYMSRPKKENDAGKPKKGLKKCAKTKPIQEQHDQIQHASAVDNPSLKRTKHVASYDNPYISMPISAGAFRKSGTNKRHSTSPNIAKKDTNTKPATPVLKNRKENNADISRPNAKDSKIKPFSIHTKEAEKTGADPYCPGARIVHARHGTGIV